jgi:hypothetical protein
MHSTVDYTTASATIPHKTAGVQASTAWACSLFAAFGNADSALYGRNFDWEHSPALLLFTDPPGGYASISMVDIAYLVAEDKVDRLMELPLTERTELLAAPQWPFDGMNEHGLVVGMAAVPDSQVPQVPGRERIGSLGVIRKMLDNARVVEEAVAIIESYNIIFDGGPQIHYLIGDATGRAVVVELYAGEVRQIHNIAPWHAATNYTLSAIEGDRTGHCWRYDMITSQLAKDEGKLSQIGAMNLLSNVAQPNTQWSIVYNLPAQTVFIALERDYEHTHLFSLWE